MLLQSGKKQHRRSLKFAIVCVALGVTVLAAKVLWTQWRRHASESRCDETTEQRLRLVSVTKCNSSKGTPRNARNTIHFITAVRRQTETYADLTRLANALAQVRWSCRSPFKIKLEHPVKPASFLKVANLHWHLIEIDDDDSGSPCTNAYHEVPSRLNIVNTHVRLGVAHRTRDASDKQACLSDISVFKMAVKWSLANEHLNGFVHFGRLGSLYPPGFFNGLEGSKNVTAYTNVFALEGEEDEEPVNIGFLAPVTDQDGVVGFAGAIPPGFSYPLAFVYRSEYLKSATVSKLNSYTV